MNPSEYYGILGLEPGASPADIKRAYFRKIRQFTPEKHPEEFQRIREAYERLKDGAPAEEGPVFPPFSQPFAGKMMENVDRLERAGALERARDTCEEARRYFPEDRVFSWRLIRLHRLLGNSGKAVKCAEELVRQEPENVWFRRELALSLYDRGWIKKAMSAFRQAYGMNARDPEFLLRYAQASRGTGSPEQGLTLLMPLIRQERRWSDEDLPLLESIYEELAEAAFICGEENLLPEILASVTQAVRRHGEKLALEMSSLTHSLFVLQSEESDEVNITGDILHFLEACRDVVKDKESRAAIEQDIRLCRMLTATTDPDLHLWLKYAAEVVTSSISLQDLGWEKQAFRLSETDYTLCLLQERESILPQEAILRERHPWLYEALKDTFDLMKDPARTEIRKSALIKTLLQTRRQFAEPTHFEENYPEELSRRAARERLAHNSEEEGTYIRAGKKIGRNDPCPCGSGKKYKQCCMKKA